MLSGFGVQFDATTSPFKRTASLWTQGSEPIACQVNPSHRATLVTATPPTLSNEPPTTTSPFGRVTIALAAPPPVPARMSNSSPGSHSGGHWALDAIPESNAAINQQKADNTHCRKAC